MSQYLIPIQAAFLVFPFLAALFTIPYILYQYHKYGSVPVLRSLIVYSFILYLTNIYFLVILPLPSFEYVSQLNTPRTQLVPFQFVIDFIHNVKVSGDPRTWLHAFASPEFYQVAYNIVMMVPFGVYLRYYFKCGWFKTILLSFLLSFFFELTQLTGLYGIYSRGYRLFDVDDLMLNTLGGILGFVITPIFWKFLPSRDRLDEMAYQKSAKISFLRRFVAYSIDWFFMGILLSFMNFFFGYFNINDWNFVYILSILLYFVLLPCCYKGQTLGKRFVNIKITTLDGKKPKWYQYLLRYGILYFFLFSIPHIILQLLETLSFLSSPIVVVMIVIILFLIILFLSFLWGIIRIFFGSDHLLFYEKISNTQNQNTIQVNKEEES